MSAERFDIVVVGGGMVGASLAVAIAPLGLSVAVVERYAPGTEDQPSYDDRSTAVAAGSQRIFTTMGLWPSLAAGATAIHRIHVSDRGRFGRTMIDHRDYGLDALGYVIENRVLGAELWRELARTANVTLLAPATVTGVSVAPGSATISTDTGQALSAGLLVVADGARSRVRGMLGIGSTSTCYGQTAVITNVTPERFHDHVAYERFTDTGPLAFLPMSNGRCSVVWTVASDEADAVMALDDQAFLVALTERFGHRLGRLTRTGKRVSYPLHLVTVDDVTAPRTVLVGNAAHGLHPVAGQGFNLGLRDVAALADVLADAVAAVDASVEEALDPGADAVLRAYRQWRCEDQAATVDRTDGLVRLFSNAFGPLGFARGLGLAAMDVVAPARHALAARSMGLSGRLPRLARGIKLT